MRVLRVIAILLTLVILAGLIGIFAVGMTTEPEQLADIAIDKFGGIDVLNSIFGSGHNWKNSFSGTVVDSGKASVPAGDVSAIKVQWISGRVEIAFHAGSDILLEQTCKTDIPEDRRLVYKVEADGTLSMREGGDSKVKSKTPTSLTVYLPEGKTELRELVLSGVSSDIVAGGLNVDKDVELSGVSGDVRLSGLHAGGDINISTTSGDVTLDGVEAASEIDVSSVSGDVRGSVSAHEFKTNTVSGAVALLGSNFDKLECESVSGDIAVQTRRTPQKVNFSTTSGDCKLTLPTDASGFEAEYSTVSGDFKCDFEVVQRDKHDVVHGDGAAKFEFGTVSGDVAIRCE